jgi:uncharacterized protein YjiS (DUF1127 family)
MIARTDKAFLTSFTIDQTSGAVFGRVGGGLRRVWGAWRRERARAQAVDELLRLDDRLLADMGVQRWELRDRVESGRPFDDVDL